METELLNLGQDLHEMIFIYHKICNRIKIELMSHYIMCKKLVFENNFRKPAK